MPTNNTENIYSTPFNEGEAQPIPASRISYDGTGTSIEATNVQAAITEVDTDLQSTKDDVDTLKTELTSAWVISDLGSDITIKGDGTKTLATLMGEMATAIEALKESLADDERIMGKYFSISGIGRFIPQYNTGIRKASTGWSYYWVNVQNGTTSVTTYNAQLANNSVSANHASITGDGVTITDDSTRVLSATDEVVFRYEIYKQV